MALPVNLHNEKKEASGSGLSVGLPKHSRDLLRILASDGGPFSMGMLSSLSKKSRRMIYYDIDSIAYFLKANSLGQLRSTEEGYSLTALQRRKSIQLINSQYVFDYREIRIGYIICLIMWPSKPTRLSDLVTVMDVSRNAVLNDIQEAKQRLERYQLALRNTKKDGYFISGDTFRKRTVYLYYINALLQTDSQYCLNFVDAAKIEEYSKTISVVFDELKIGSDRVGIQQTAFLLDCIQKSPTLYRFNVADMNYICNSPVLDLVDKHFPFLSSHERIYLTIHIIGFTGQRNLPDNLIESNLDLMNLASELVNLFQNLACISFSDEQGLVNSIYMHLKLSYYNYFHRIPMVNPLQNDIKEHYSDLYKITESCCEKLNDKFPYPVFDSEITYLTMHFGASMRSLKNAKSRANILIVCLNLTTSAILLNNEIANEFPRINIVGLIKPSQISTVTTRGIDFIVSTINFQADVPVILVHSVLTADDRANIAAFVMMSNVEDRSEMNQLQVFLDILKRNVDDSVYKNITAEMNTYMNAGGSFISLPSDAHVGMVSMLSRYGIMIDPGIGVSWEQAIRDTASPLFTQNAIIGDYITTIIGLVHSYGPYIVINENIAIAHAQPTDGVNRLGLSLTIYPQGLAIGHHTVHLLYVLAPIDQSAHLGILKDIISLNDDAGTMDKVIHASSAEKALDDIKKCLARVNDKNAK